MPLLHRRLSRGRRFHVLYLIGITLKGIDGILETGAGIALLVLGTPAVKWLAWFVAGAEYTEEPGNPLARYVVNLGKYLSVGSKTFAGIYLVAHGAIKVALVAAMFKRVRWAFPVAVVIILGFIGYQSFRLSAHLSYMLLALTITDALIVLLILREYAEVRRMTPGKM